MDKEAGCSHKAEIQTREALVPDSLLSATVGIQIPKVPFCCLDF